MEVEIPIDLLAEGAHRVGYRIFSPNTQYEVYSDTIPLVIDRTAPGAPQLAPIIFPDVIQNGLTSSELEDLNNVLPGKIAGYSGMAAGDEIRTYWGPMEGPMTIVDANDMGLSRVMVDFTRPFMEPADGLTSAVTYTVTDRAGNVSMVSDPVMIELQLATLQPLPDPMIREAKDQTLDPADAVNGATLVVGATANLREGETVIAHWNGPKGSDRQEKIVSAAEAGQELTLVFTNSAVAVNDGQNVEVVYTVTRASGIVQESARLMLKVMSAALELPAPTVDTVGPEGILRPSLIAGPDAIVRVSYRAMQSQDLVRVRWVDQRTFDTNIISVGDMTELVFGVPKAVIELSVGGTATLTYIVTRNGVDAESEPLEVSVREDMMFDTSPVTLAGKVYLLPAHPDLLPAFPTGTTVHRVASGGRPPYTYSSSDAKVARVDASGLTSVRGKGTATITATDASGESKSFTVSVTGVIECHGVGSGNYTQMSNAANRIGARIPSIHELIEIYNAYGNRWPMGNANYWSSTVAKNVLGAKWYYVKNLNVGGDYKLLHINSSLGVAIR
nr:Ig-like domain-containing protein [Pseudomonas petrae]